MKSLKLFSLTIFAALACTQAQAMMQFLRRGQPVVRKTAITMRPQTMRFMSTENNSRQEISKKLDAINNSLEKIHAKQERRYNNYEGARILNVLAGITAGLFIGLRFDDTIQAFRSEGEATRKEIKKIHEKLNSIKIIK